MIHPNLMAIGLAAVITACSESPQPPVRSEVAYIEAAGEHAYREYIWTQPESIPDNDERGVFIGPIVTQGDTNTLGPVALRVEISHPHMADLAIQLEYDSNGDGVPETKAPVEFHRARPRFAADQENAVSPSVDGTYFFRDGTQEWETAFGELQGLPRGHAFYLSVADTMVQDTGTVRGWAVYVEEPQALVQE